MLVLYYVFFYIGLIAFGGGYVILPLIQGYIVNTYHWISNDVLVDIIAISQITPGPIAINAATFIGMTKEGILGAIVATLGVITPQILMLLALIKYIGLDSKIMGKIVDGIKPATVSLIFIALINISKSSLYYQDNLQYRVVITFFLALILSKFKVKFVYIILLSGIVGILFT